MLSEGNLAENKRKTRQYESHCSAVHFFCKDSQIRPLWKAGAKGLVIINDSSDSRHCFVFQPE